MSSEVGGRQSIFGGTLWGGAAAVITAVAGFGVAAVLTRHFGPARFGEFAALVAWGGAVSVLADGGLATALSQEAAKRPGTQAALLRSSVRHRAVLSLVGVVVGVVVISALGQARPSVFALAAVCIALQLDLAMELPFAVWRAGARYRRASVWRIGRRIVYFLAVAVAVPAGVGVAGVGVLMLATAIPFAIGATVVASRITPGQRSAATSLPRATATLFWVSGVLYWIYFQADQILLAAFDRPVQLGLYAPAVAVATAYLILPSVIADVIFPRLCAELAPGGGGELGMRETTLLQVPLFAGFGGLVCVGLGLGSADATRLLFGSQFAGTAPLLALLGVFIAIRFIALPATIALPALDRLRSLVVLQVVAAVLNVVGNLILIGPIGAKGSAIATLGSETLMLLGTWCLLPGTWAIPAAKLALPYAILTAAVFGAHLALGGARTTSAALVLAYCVIASWLAVTEMRGGLPSRKLS